jgi:hypothetical protein
MRPLGGAGWNPDMCHRMALAEMAVSFAVSTPLNAETLTWSASRLGQNVACFYYVTLSWVYQVHS